MILPLYRSSLNAIILSHTHAQPTHASNSTLQSRLIPLFLWRVINHRLQRLSQLHSSASLLLPLLRILLQDDRVLLLGDVHVEAGVSGSHDVTRTGVQLDVGALLFLANAAQGDAISVCICK